jgi:hypothetical protein
MPFAIALMVCVDWFATNLSERKTRFEFLFLWFYIDLLLTFGRFLAVGSWRFAVAQNDSKCLCHAF